MKKKRKFDPEVQRAIDEIKDELRGKSHKWGASGGFCPDAEWLFTGDKDLFNYYNPNKYKGRKLG